MWKIKIFRDKLKMVRIVLLLKGSWCIVKNVNEKEFVLLLIIIRDR